MPNSWLAWASKGLGFGREGKFFGSHSREEERHLPHLRICGMWGRHQQSLPKSCFGAEPSFRENKREEPGAQGWKVGSRQGRGGG